MNIKKLILISSLVLPATQLSACTLVGAAAGAGAAVGIASQQEGGISSAATDLRIKADIGDKWFKYKVDTFSKLSTTVDQGRVLVTGVVQNPDDRVEAVRLVWQVNGVKQVINEIRVADSEGVPGFVRDKWITTRLRTELTFTKDIGAVNYTIDTVQGTVYLMGVARNQGELDRVIAIARRIPNVKEVVSYVKPLGESVQGSAVQTPTYSQAAPVSGGAAMNAPVEREVLSGNR